MFGFLYPLQFSKELQAFGPGQLVHLQAVVVPQQSGHLERAQALQEGRVPLYNFRERTSCTEASSFT